MSLFCCPSCGLPAEDVDRFVVTSTDGPIEYLTACCIQYHRFTIPAESVAEGADTATAARPATNPMGRPVPLMEPERPSEITVPTTDPERFGLPAAIWEHPAFSEANPHVARPSDHADRAVPHQEPPVVAAHPPVASDAGNIVMFPAARTPADAFRAPRTWLAGGGFVAGGVLTGMLLSVPPIVSLAVIMGLLCVAVVATLIPVALARHAATKVAPTPLHTEADEAPRRSRRVA